MSNQMHALYVPDGVTPSVHVPVRQADGTYSVPVACDGTGKLGVTGIAGGGGGSGDASAANQATQITRETEIRDRIGTTADAAPADATATGTLLAWQRWIARAIGTPSDAAASSGTLSAMLRALVARLPTSIGPQNAASSLAVTLASDGAFATAVGTTTASAPADGATSGTLIGWVRAAVETLRTRLPTLSAGRLPVETRFPQVYSEVVSLVGLAAGTSLYGSVIDLGANRGQALVTALKSSGFNQSDAIAIQQSDDPLFATWTYCPRGDRTVGAVFSWTNAAGANVAVTACPSMRYARPVFVCLAGGSAQPAGSSMVIGALPGGL